MSFETNDKQNKFQNKSIIAKKTYSFALQIIVIYKKLIKENEYVLSK